MNTGSSSWKNWSSQYHQRRQGENYKQNSALSLVISKLALKRVFKKWMENPRNGEKSEQTKFRLKCRFGDKLISNKSDFTWPPRSPDLNPLDFHFWGDMKQKIHEGSLRSLMDAKNFIGHIFRKTAKDTDMLKRITAQFCYRIKCCIQANGGLFE